MYEGKIINKLLEMFCVYSCFLEESSIRRLLICKIVMLW